MIFRENYYKKIFNATDLAGKYNSENKRYYFNFYNFLDKSNTKLNSREIWLAKNQIFKTKQLKCNIEYQLYQQNLVNNIVNHNKYQELKCGEGYNFLSEKGFNDYLSKKIFIIILIQIYKKKIVKIFVIIETDKTLLKHLKIEYLYIVLFIKSIMKPAFPRK